MRFEALNKLWEKVSESSHDFRASTQIFPSLDTDRIARDLSLKKLGEERGAKEHPTKGSSSMDDVELNIVERIEDEKKSAHQILEDQLQTFSDRLTNLDFEGQFSMIRLVNATTVTDYIAECEAGINELHGPRRALDDAEKERVAFRKQHNLERAARVQKPYKKVIKWLFLVLFLLLEIGLNSVFLSAGSEQGIIGGATLSWGFAFLNIGIAFIAAYVVKFSLHRSFLGKIVGVVALPIYAGLATGLNLALAHYRETSEELFGEAGREVIRRLTDEPFVLADVQSWILFGVGVLLSIAAFVDSWLLADPYPGYSGVETRLLSARKMYVDIHRDLIDNLRDVRDEYTSKIEDIISDLSSRKREYDAIIDHRGRIAQLFEQHQDGLEVATNSLLKIYREQNRQSRSTPAPKYFQKDFKLKRIEPAQKVIGELNDSELSESISKAREELSQQAKSIADEFSKAVTKYPNLDILHPDQHNGQR